MKIKMFSYNQLDTFIHNLSGLTKLICFLLLTTAIMFSYDLRVILAVTFISFACLLIAKVQFSQVKLMVIYVLIFLVLNFVLTYLFEPEYGVEIYGTRHLLFNIVGRYTVTLEQILYQITKFMKYFSVIPLGITFFLTTNPSEFASSLNKIKISYKACTALSLTLRYFPDIQRDYQSISLSQQARGIDLSKNEKLVVRVKNMIKILIPLIITTLDRVEVITNAMELRGYGKSKTRTWFSYRKLYKADYFAIVFCIIVLVITICVSLFINHSAFWNPFV